MDISNYTMLRSRNIIIQNKKNKKNSKKFLTLYALGMRLKESKFYFESIVQKISFMTIMKFTLITKQDVESQENVLFLGKR